MDALAPLRAAVAGWKDEAERALADVRRLEAELATTRDRLESLEERHTQLGFEARRALEDAVVSREARDDARRRAEGLEEALSFLRAERDRLQIEITEAQTSLLHERVLLESVRSTLKERGEDPSGEIARTRDLQRQVRVLRTESIELKRKISLLESVLPKEVAGAYELAAITPETTIEMDEPPTDGADDLASRLVLYKDDVRGLLHENRSLITSRLADMVSGRSRWRLFDMALLVGLLLSIFLLVRVLCWPLRLLRRRREARSLEAERRRVRDLERQIVLLHADLEDGALPQRVRLDETSVSTLKTPETPGAISESVVEATASPVDSLVERESEPPVEPDPESDPEESAASLEDSRFLRDLEGMLDFRTPGASAPVAAKGAPSGVPAASFRGDGRALSGTAVPRGEVTDETAVEETVCIGPRSRPTVELSGTRGPAAKPRPRPRVPLSVDDLDAADTELDLGPTLAESSLTEVIESLCDVEFRMKTDDEDDKSASDSLIVVRFEEEEGGSGEKPQLA